MARIAPTKHRNKIPPHLVGRRAADAIIEDLRAQIASGAIAHGARLPPERTLAETYGVSGPTVREALQGLNAMGLLDVRHGSGTYVSASADSLIAKSLGTVIEMQGVSVQNLIGLLGALNAYAARVGATLATKADIASLEQSVQALTEARDTDAIVRALKDFVAGIVATAHDPLLLAIARFLLDIQLSLVTEMSKQSASAWRALVSELQPDRLAIIEALKRRDADEFVARVNAFQARAVSLIDARVPHSRVPASDGRLVDILAQLAAPERRFTQTAPLTKAKRRT
jgi:GntR family transcriptional regulator, transcriptional repressor for pyruvate dehydrogenase complex